MGKPKYTKIGQLLKSKKGNKYARLGLTDSKNTNYNFDVKIQVVNGKGDKVMVKNPNLAFFEPKKLTKDGKEIKVPEWVLGDICIVEDSEESDLS